MVIWQWYGNDFNDDYGLFSGPDVTNPFLIAPPSTGNKANKGLSINKWLAQNSAVYVLSTLGIRAASEQSSMSIFRDQYQIHDGSVTFDFGRPYIQDSFDLSNPNNQQGLETSRQALREALDTLTPSATPLLIILIPSKEEVYRRWTEGPLGSAWFDTVGKGRQEMLGFCQTEKFACLDMTPILVSHANQREMVYWPDDIHLNPSGNKIVADAMWEFIAQHNLMNK
jgi:hypothetical protein